MTLVTADELNDFASHELSRRLLPRLVGRLLADETGVVNLDMPTGVWRPGWDGIVGDAPGSLFVPRGASGWEFSNDKSPVSAANTNLSKRTENPEGLDPAGTTFVFATMRHWKAKRAWKQQATSDGPWKGVWVLDSDDLAQWLEANPRLHRWITKLIRGHQRSGVCSSDLPPDLTNFVGRELELEAIAEHLDGGKGPRSAVIWGQPGSGKTSLAVRAGHMLRDHFPDGCFYIDVAAAGSPDRAALQTTMLRRLGYDNSDLPERDDAIASTYLAETHHRIFIVVLDNVTSEEQARALMPGDSDSLLLIASRSRLSGLDNVQRVKARPFSPAEGISVISRERGLPLSGDDEEAARRIVRLCGGLPLAVRIAARMAARTPGWNLDRLVGRLESEESRINRLRVGDVAVRTVFNSAYEALPPGHQRILRHACSLPGTTFTAALLGVAVEESPDNVDDVLDELVDGALVSAHNHTGCYRVHDLLAIFAYERFKIDEDPGRQEEVNERVLAWLLDGMSTARGQVWNIPLPIHGMLPESPRPAAPAEALRWLDTHYLNIFSAISGCHAAGNYNFALTFVLAIADHCELRGLWRDLNYLVTIARDCLVSVEKKGTANTPVFKACDASVSHLEIKVAWGLGEFERALELADASLKTALDANTRGHALLMRAQILRSLDRAEEAIQDNREARTLFDSDEGDEVGLNLALHNLGATLSEAGDPEAAIPHLIHEMKACLAQGDRLGAAHTMNTLAIARMRLGDVEEAEKLLRDSIEISVEYGDFIRAGHAYNDLGLLMFADSRFEEAYACHLQDLEYCHILADDRGAQQAMLRIADNLLEIDDDRAREALPLTATVGRYALGNDDRELQAAVAAVMGKAGYMVGNFDQADDCYGAAAAIYSSRHDYEALVGTRAAQLTHAAAAGRISHVEPAVRELLDELAEAGQPLFQAVLTGSLAQALATVGDDDGVQQLISDAAALMDSTPLKRWLED